MKPQEKNFASHVAYTRALEVYCAGLEKFIEGKNGYKERIQQLYEENLSLGSEIDLADKVREECALIVETESQDSTRYDFAYAIRAMKERP